MIRQTRADAYPSHQAADDTWLAFFLAPDSEEEPSTRAEAMGLDAWTTEQLLAEVVQRSAEDPPALRRMQGDVLQALLTAIDRQSAPATPASDIE